MILIDFSQIAIASYMTLLGTKNVDVKVNDNLLKHAISNHIRALIIKHKSKYQEGGVYLCCDSKSWRKESFEYYKAARRKSKKNDDTDWEWYYDFSNNFLEEIVQNFPLRVIKAQGAEADDIFAIMSRHYSNRFNILIATADKDMNQLISDRVQVYCPFKRKFSECKDPKRFLLEHIIRGDSGDGIPNIKSPDNVFVESGMRQASIMTKKVNQWIHMKPEEYCDTAMLRNFSRNKMLIDFDYIPSEVEESIIAVCESEMERKPKTVRELRSYLIKNSMNVLRDNLTDFSYDDGITSLDKSNPFNLL